MPKSRPQDTVEQAPHVKAYHALQDALTALQAAKPGDRSDADCNYGICVTDLQKIIGFYNTYIFIPAQAEANNGSN